MKGKIFNTNEVQSILNGSKVMFREIAKIKLSIASYNFDTKQFYDDPIFKKCPYQVGQKIFVKERFFEEIHPDSLRKNGKIHYGASCDYEVIKVDGDGFQIFYKDGTPASPWKSPVHMKQEHSRITLEITDVKVERLKDISVDDCWKEGMDYLPECCQNYIAIPDCNGNPTPSCCNNPNVVHPQPQFEQIWNATHKKPEEKFEVNPFVWVVDFKINK